MRHGWLVVLIACGGGAAKPVAPKLETGSFKLAVEGTEVAYSIRGTGPVCIAHPGGPGLDSSYLRSAILEKYLTVVYIDPLGTGPSGKLPETEEYSRERDVRVVDAVRRKLGIDKVCLIGHSYGGFVVLDYAATLPDHVGALLLYSTAAVSDAASEKEIGANIEAEFKHEPWYPAASKAFEGEDKAVDQAAMDKVLADELPIMFADWSGKKAMYAAAAASFKVYFDVSRRRARGKAHDYDVRRRLGALHTTPTMVIAGDKDPICGVKPSTALASEIAGSDLVVIKGAGHMAHVEQPDAFGDAVKTFAAKLR